MTTTPFNRSVLIVAIVVLLGAGGYVAHLSRITGYVTASTSPSPSSTAQPIEARATASPSPEPTGNFVEDENIVFHFPDDMVSPGGDVIPGSSNVLDWSVTDIASADAPLGYDSANFLADRTALQHGDPSVDFGQSVAGSLKMIEVPGAIGKEHTVLQQIDVCDVTFIKEAIFYRGDKVYRISSQADPETIEKANPSYFTKDSANCGGKTVWKNAQGFYNDLITGKTDRASQEWYADLGKILPTIQFK